MGTLRDEVVLQAGADALEVGAQPGVVEVVVGTFPRSSAGRMLGQTVDQVKLAYECGKLLALWRVVGGMGRTQNY